MEDTRDDAGPAEQGPPNASWWPSDFMERFGSVSLVSQEETLSNTDSPRSLDQDVFSSQKASQVLWQTGMLFEPIPNGFYSLIPVRFNFWRQLIVICCSYNLLLLLLLLPVTSCLMNGNLGVIEMDVALNIYTAGLTFYLYRKVCSPRL